MYKESGEKFNKIHVQTFEYQETNVGKMIQLRASLIIVTNDCKSHS